MTVEPNNFLRCSVAALVGVAAIIVAIRTSAGPARAQGNPGHTVGRPAGTTTSGHAVGKPAGTTTSGHTVGKP